MGTKRPRTHHADNIHPSRQVNHQPAKPFRQKLSNPVQTFTSSTSINPIKGKIRNLVRLLERPGELPPGVRIEKERALTGYRQDLAKANEEKRKQQMIKKYHMVRFFERQKATRNLKKLKSRLSKTTADTPEYGDLQKNIHDAEVDLNYSLYYPLNEKYQSLYPRSEGQGSEIKSEIGDMGERNNDRPKVPLWTMVESCMREGTLEALRDGKLGRNSKVAGPKPVSTVRSQKVKARKGAITSTAKPELAEEAEMMSDDGFFEE